MSLRRSRSLPLAALGALLLALAACSSTPPPAAAPGATYKLGDPYRIGGRWYYPVFDPDYDEVGTASWYGDAFDGLPTANGEVFDRTALTAAHPTMPLPSIVQVTNLENDRSLRLRVNDRGPFVGDRLIDVSQAAAQALGFERAGTTPVRVRFLQLADADGPPPQPGPPQPGPMPAAPAPAAPAPAPALQVAAATPVAACRASGRFIQVGAFAEPARAERLAHQLQSALWVPVRTAPASVDHLVRVWLGPLARPDEITSALQRLEQIGYQGAFLVQSLSEPTRNC